MSTTKKCTICNIEYQIENYKAARSRFCSRICKGADRAKSLNRKRSEIARARRISVVQPLTYRIIPITKGMVALVDIEDEDLSDKNWHYHEGYARCQVQRSVVAMHRLVLSRKIGRPLADFERPDHIDCNRLNNRRSNLRLATERQNRFNQLPRSGSYKGVCKKDGGRFQASINADYTNFIIGRFDTADEAAWMRDQWALELHGEFARLNFKYIEVSGSSKS